MKIKKSSTNEIAARLQALEDLSTELVGKHSTPQLLSSIVNKAVDLFECDAGSLFLAGPDDVLYFEVAVNKSLTFDFERKSLPVGDRGLASWVFRSGESLRIEDVNEISEFESYSFNSSFDTRVGYKTKSVLVHPLKNRAGETVGVIQLINKKSAADVKWPLNDPKKLKKMPEFSTDDERLLKSFAAVASSSLENTKLQTDIENLFEGFVRASVHAIESRDLVTRGHSDRVAVLTVDLARKISDEQGSDLKNIYFSENQLSELRYAALLHDFGKIGVRESTLQKEEKLNPEQKIKIYSRLEEFKASTEIRALRELVNILHKENRAPNDWEMAAMDKKIRDFNLKLTQYWDIIIQMNRPTVMHEEVSKQLVDLSQLCCLNKHGEETHLLEKEDVLSLSIKKGSLSEAERIEIESHVTHSFAFLRKIPWTKHLSGVPEIAFAHHERIDGSGYPRGISKAQIPVQARIMTICDIFDALTAKDRPYKAAVPIERAIDILMKDAKAGSLEMRFLTVFIEAKIFENSDYLRLNVGPTKIAA